MCRVLSYLGPPVLLDELLYKPDSSLVRQSYAPQQLSMLNLGGFGMVAWDPESPNPHKPWTYRSTELPVFDANLKAMAMKARAGCLLAHVRGIAYRTDSGFGPHNLHPFQFQGSRWAMAHNGDLSGHASMKPDILRHVSPSIRAQIRGTTDSETMYALVMSQLREPMDAASPDALLQAVVDALQIVRDVRANHGIERSSSMNLFFTDGESILALRYTYDFGCYGTDDPASVHTANIRYLSLWYTAGERYAEVDGEWRTVGAPGRYDAFLLASEPLTRDVTGWVEVPEYSALMVHGKGAERRVSMADIDV